MKKIVECGVISTTGQLRLPMDRINAFFRENKGMRVLARFEVAEPGSTELQRGYYRGYIVPLVQEQLWKEGERMTTDQVDNFLRKQCPSCYNEQGELLEVEKIAKSDFSDFIEWLKQYAAENLYLYIEDPKTL